MVLGGVCAFPTSCGSAKIWRVQCQLLGLGPKTRRRSFKGVCAPMTCRKSFGSSPTFATLPAWPAFVRCLPVPLHMQPHARGEEAVVPPVSVELLTPHAAHTVVSATALAPSSTSTNSLDVGTPFRVPLAIPAPHPPCESRFDPPPRPLPPSLAALARPSVHGHVMYTAMTSGTVAIGCHFPSDFQRVESHRAAVRSLMSISALS